MYQREFDLYLDRARRFFKRLENRFFLEDRELHAEIRTSADPIPIAERKNGPFRPIREGEVWGGPWESAWFRLTATIPEEWCNEPLALRLGLGGEGLILDPDGVPYFGLSAGSVYGIHYRKELFEIPSRWVRPRMEFWVEAAANGLFGINRDGDPELDAPNPRGSYRAAAEIMRIGRFNRELWHLRLDLEVLLSLLEALPPRGRRTDSIVMAINRAANVFAENAANAGAARRELTNVLSMPACGSAMTAIGVGHAHIDTGWMWPVRESVRKCARTFASQLRLMEKYPDYIFGASAPQHYAFVKEHYPELYEQIKRRVAEGRWELQGGMWVEADCNLISGESMVRQFLHGKNFFRDEFGVEVRNLWIPDVFGYSASMPQILRLAGCDFFLTQKISWSQFNKFPYHTFWWRGIDGSEVLTHFPPEDTYNATVLPGQLAAAQDRFNENTVLDEFMSLYGIGDGGGGPKEEYVERALRLRDLEGVPRFRFGRADDFFERLKQHGAELHHWSGELYLEFHRGTLTTQARTKKNNRKLEQLLAATEFIHALAPLDHYPAEELDRLWKTLLINQFHDIIPGSSIRLVYEVTERQHREAIEDCNRLIESAARQLAQTDENALLLFNPLPVDATEAVELPANWAESGALDEAGTPLPCQREGDRSLVRCTVPAHGSRTLRRGGASVPVEKSAELVLENDLVRYEFNDRAELVRAFDKERQCDVMGSGRIGNEFRLYVDRPNSHEAWDIELFYKQQLCGQVRSAGRPEKFTGAVRSGLEFRLVIGDSPLFQRITLAPGSRRLDFETRIDWREARKLLRVTFPVDAFSEEASYDIPYGYLRRPVHTNTSWDMARFEVAGQRYADLSDARGGAALLNDCKYGYSAEPGALSLTLLRSPKYPDWDADLGIQEFTYSFLPHRGTLTESEVMDEAARLNRPPLALPGFAGELRAPVTVEPGDVSFTVLKKAEKEECRVIRLVETAGRFSKARLHTEAELVETDLLEWNDGAHLKPTGGSIELEFRPFQIRTFKLRGE